MVELISMLYHHVVANLHDLIEFTRIKLNVYSKYNHPPCRCSTSVVKLDVFYKMQTFLLLQLKKKISFKKRGLPYMCSIYFKTHLSSSSPEYACNSFISSLIAVGVIRISLNL